MELGMPKGAKSVADSPSRRYLIGGSDARIIMGSNEATLVRLWREKRGEVEPEDLSGNLVVQLGVATEDLNRRWYEANTGQVVTDIQKRVHHPALRWMAANLDGAGSMARPRASPREHQSRGPRNRRLTGATIQRPTRCRPV